MLRRREYAELHDEATDRQGQQLYNSDGNVPLVGLISGRHGMADITTKVENTTHPSSSRASSKEAPKSWWKPPRWRKKQPCDDDNSENYRIGIAERPECAQQHQDRPRGRSRKPKRTTSSKAKPNQNKNRDKVRSSRRLNSLLTIEENVEFDIERYSC